MDAQELLELSMMVEARRSDSSYGSQAEDTESWTCADMGVVPQEEDYVHVARSQPRDQETGRICFDVTYTDGSHARVPILRFIDEEDGTFTHSDVAQAVNDWIETAKRHPFTRRSCLCCFERATKGGVLCTRHTATCGEAVYA